MDMIIFIQIITNTSMKTTLPPMANNQSIQTSKNHKIQQQCVYMGRQEEQVIHENLQMKKGKSMIVNMSKIKDIERMSQTVTHIHKRDNILHKSHRYRNDHSIQVKTPIKVPLSQFNKSQLTFRKRQDLQAMDLQTAKQNMRSNANLSCNNAKFDQNTSVNVIANEKQIVYCLYECVRKLQKIDVTNQIVKKYQPLLKTIVKQMMSGIDGTDTKYEGQTMGSSHKIQLQNMVCSSRFWEQHPQQSYKAGHAEHYCMEADEEEQNKNCKEELEMKKIMYMLEGNKINIRELLGGEDEQYGLPSATSSISSFNAVSCSTQSAFTVLQIERQLSSNRNYTNRNQKDVIQSDRIQDDSNRMSSHRCKSQISVGSDEGSSKMNTGSDKRKVLHDIISLLNHKYNKNIHLQ